MLKVDFPKTKVPVIRRLCNIVKTKGDILTPKERQYAKELTDEVRTSIVPWANEPEMNQAVLADLRAEFENKVKTENPKHFKGVIHNVEDYVFKEAQYHYNVMADNSVQNKLIDVCPTSAKVLENTLKRDACLHSIEKILGSPLKGDESWEDIESVLRLHKVNHQRRNFCRMLYKKAQAHDMKRVEKVLERTNQLAANEAAAKQYGVWKSYDYVYNNPTTIK